MGITNTRKQTGTELVQRGKPKVGEKWVEILPANPLRQGITVYNPTESTIFIDYGDSKGGKDGFMLELQPYCLWESAFICKAPLIARSEGQNVVIHVRDFS